MTPVLLRMPFWISASTDELVAQALRGSYPWGKLGMAPHSTREACRKRYLALALRLHPDKAGGHPRAQEAFRAVEAAFRAIERGGARG